MPGAAVNGEGHGQFCPRPPNCLCGLIAQVRADTRELVAQELDALLPDGLGRISKTLALYAALGAQGWADRTRTWQPPMSNEEFNAAKGPGRTDGDGKDVLYRNMAFRAEHPDHVRGAEGLDHE